MPNLLIPQTMLQLAVAAVATLTATLGSVFYLRRVQLERPTIGTFNLRDIATLTMLVVCLPLLYLALPQWSFTYLLTLTFGSALAIGLRPLLPRSALWFGIAILLAANIWVARTMLGTQHGWQLYWVLCDLIVLLAAISIANLFVQGGMRMQHAACFVMALAVYDFLFAEVWPLTQALTDRFVGFPLNPGFGIRWSIFGVEIGLGDLLAFSFYAAATYKAYGPRALRIALAFILVFGIAAGSLTPLLVREVIRGSLNVVVPVQALFGPPALGLYFWLRRRYGPERTMAQFRAGLQAGAAPGNARAASPIELEESGLGRTVREGAGYRLGPAAYLEPGEDVLEVLAHGRLRDP
jgi:hypothetical protein